jgi:hypothetical protein
MKKPTGPARAGPVFLGSPLGPRPAPWPWRREPARSLTHSRYAASDRAYARGHGASYDNFPSGMDVSIMTIAQPLAPPEESRK